MSIKRRIISATTMKSGLVWLVLQPATISKNGFHGPECTGLMTVQADPKAYEIAKWDYYAENETFVEGDFKIVGQHKTERIDEETGEVKVSVFNVLTPQ